MKPRSLAMTTVGTLPTNSTSLPNVTFQVDDDSWDTLLDTFEVINFLLLIVTTWVILSMIVYGTMTRRWRKNPGSSSLNSGLIYATCTIAVVFLLPPMVITAALYHLKRIPNGLEWCEFVCDMGNLAFYASLSGTYIFIWLRLRFIYIHPYVKERISRHAKYFIILLFITIVIVSIGLICFYVIPDSYQASSNGCTHQAKKQGHFFQGPERNILLAVLLLCAQSLMMCIAIYPAIRVKFVAQMDAEANAIQSSGNTRKSLRIKSSIASNIMRGGGPRSPIEIAVRRTLISCAVMVVSDILAVLPVVFLFPRDSPAQLRRTAYNIGSCVNMFCMLSTFGFAFRILTLFFACFRIKCKRKVRKNPDERAVESSPSLLPKLLHMEATSTP